MASRRFVVLAGVALLVALLIVRGAPWITYKREVTASVPTPPVQNVITPLVAKPGSVVCAQQVTFSPDSQMVRFMANAAPGTKIGPLLVSVAGPGYSTQTAVPGGHRAEAAFEVPLKTPSHSLIGQLCIKNTGHQTVAFQGTAEGLTMSRSPAFVDGVLQPARLPLALHRAQHASFISRIGSLFSHDAALNPLSTALVWLLAIATLLLVPLGAFWALSTAMATPDEVSLASTVAAPPFPGARRTRRARRSLAPAWARVRAVPAWAWLTLILALGFVWLYHFGAETHVFQNDEARNVYLARWVDTALPSSLWNFGIIDTGLQRLTVFILAPIVGFFGGPDWARIGHAVQSLLWMSAAIPVYLIVRGLRVPGRWAILAAALTVFVPWAVVATSFLTEPVAYPAYAFAVWAIWRSVTRAGWGNDLLALVLIVIAGTARVNLLALAAVLVIAVVAQELRFGRGRPWRERGREFVRRHAVLVGAAALVVVVVILGTSGFVSQANKLTGFYGLQNRFHVPTQLLTSKLDDYTTRFVAGIAFIPFVFGLAWAVQTLFKPRDRDRFAFAVVAFLAVAAIIYTSAGAGFDERYLIYYAPLFAVAFVVALAGRETNPVLVGASGFVGALLLLEQSWTPAPLQSFNWFVQPAETLYANFFLGRVSHDFPSPHARYAAFFLLLLVVGVCVLAASRHRSSGTLIALLVAAVVAVQFFQTDTALSEFTAGPGNRSGPSLAMRSWVDAKLYGRSHAQAFAAGPGNSPAFDPTWAELQFYNDSVTGVVTVGGQLIQIPPSDTYDAATVDPVRGLLNVKTLAPYLVVPRAFLGFGLDAKLVEQSAYLPLDLVRTRSRHLLWAASNTQADGYLNPGKPAQIRVFRASGPPPACALVTVTAPFGLKSNVDLTGAGSRRSAAVPSAQAVQLQLPLHWGSKQHLDLKLAASGKAKLADGRVQSVQLSPVGLGACPKPAGP